MARQGSPRPSVIPGLACLAGGVPDHRLIGVVRSPCAEAHLLPCDADRHGAPERGGRSQGWRRLWSARRGLCSSRRHQLRSSLRVAGEYSYRNKRAQQDADRRWYALVWRRWTGSRFQATGTAACRRCSSRRRPPPRCSRTVSSRSWRVRVLPCLVDAWNGLEPAAFLLWRQGCLVTLLHRPASSSLQQPPHSPCAHLPTRLQGATMHPWTTIGPARSWTSWGRQPRRTSWAPLRARRACGRRS